MKNRITVIFVFLFILSLSNIIDRYVVYGYVFIVIFYGLVFDKFKIKTTNELGHLSLIFFTLFGISLVLNPDIILNSYFINQVYLIFSPLLFAYIIIKNEKREEVGDLVLKGVLAASIIISLQIYFSTETFSYSILHSTSTFESGVAHTLGLCVIYSLIKKKYLYALTSSFFLILLLKRIAIIGVLVVGVYYIISTYILKKENQQKGLIIGINVLYLLVILNMLYGEFLADFARNKIGLSLDYITLGRYTLYQDLEELIKVNSILTGVGFSEVHDFLQNFKRYEHLGYNPHSDWLRIMLEFGILMGGIFLISIYKILGNRKSIYLIIYFNLLLFTENAIVYYYFMIPFYIFVATLKPTLNPKRFWLKSFVNE